MDQTLIAHLLFALNALLAADAFLKRKYAIMTLNLVAAVLLSFSWAIN